MGDLETAGLACEKLVKRFPLMPRTWVERAVSLEREKEVEDLLATGRVRQGWRAGWWLVEADVLDNMGRQATDCWPTTIRPRLSSGSVTGGSGARR